MRRSRPNQYLSYSAQYFKRRDKKSSAQYISQNIGLYVYSGEYAFMAPQPIKYIYRKQ